MVKCRKNDDPVWQATIASRARKGNGCPYCDNKIASETNSLYALGSHLIDELHKEKNGNVDPRSIVAGSSRKLWWKCPVADDHEWENSPINRKKSPNCPFCSGVRLSKTNALSTIKPEIAIEWHPSKNGTLKPEKIKYNSASKVWFRCKNNPVHEWEASVASRTRVKRATGCPMCARK